MPIIINMFMFFFEFGNSTILDSSRKYSLALLNGILSSKGFFGDELEKPSVR